MNKQKVLQRNLINPDVGIATHSYVFTEDSKYHNHEFYEFFYILGGTMEHTINDETQTLSVGDCVLIPPKFYHFFSPQNCVKRDVLVSTNLFLRAVMLITGVKENLAAPMIFKLDNSTMMEIENIFLEFSLENGLEKKKCIGLSALYKIIAASPIFSHVQTTKNEYVPQIVRNVCEKLDKQSILNVGSKRIVEELGYNQSYICRVFKKYMHCTLVDYINDIRLSHAALYLTSTNYSLQKIATDVGFSSVSYLNKLFKKKYGTTMTKYRKQNKKNIKR